MINIDYIRKNKPKVTNEAGVVVGGLINLSNEDVYTFNFTQRNRNFLQEAYEAGKKLVFEFRTTQYTTTSAYYVPFAINNTGAFKLELNMNTIRIEAMNVGRIYTSTAEDAPLNDKIIKLVFTPRENGSVAFDLYLDKKYLFHTVLSEESSPAPFEWSEWNFTSQRNRTYDIYKFYME